MSYLWWGTVWNSSGKAVHLNYMIFVEAENKESKHMHYTVDPRVTTGLTYDQHFCFDLRPVPAPAWRAHIRYHMQFTASTRWVCFVLQARPC
jgi:hypothetical protein